MARRSIRTRVIVPGLIERFDADGRSRGFWVDYRDATGYRTRQRYTTQAQAARALRQAQSAIETGTHVAPTQIPTFATIAEAWFQNKLGRRPGTVEQYRGQLDNYLLPAFGALKLSHVSVARIEQQRDAWLADPDTRIHAPTVQKLLGTASMIFRHAIKKGLWSTNPTALADRPDGGSDELGED